MWWKEVAEAHAASQECSRHARHEAPVGTPRGSTRDASIHASKLMVGESGNAFGGKDALRRAAHVTAEPTRTRRDARRFGVAAGLGLVLAASIGLGVVLSRRDTNAYTLPNAHAGMTSDSALMQSNGYTPARRGAEGDSIVEVMEHELNAHPSTAAVIAWLSEQSLLQSVGLDLTMQVQRVSAKAVATAGVELPTTTFSARGIRFNEAGEIVEILPASDVDSNACDLTIVVSTENPQHWTYSCEGRCTPPEECLLSIDGATREIACSCREELR
jgi:hypothetical protein